MRTAGRNPAARLDFWGETRISQRKPARPDHPIGFFKLAMARQTYIAANARSAPADARRRRLAAPCFRLSLLLTGPWAA
jgi:hypothetical protein